MEIIHSFLFEIDYEIHTSLSFSLIFISYFISITLMNKNHFILSQNENETKENNNENNENNYSNIYDVKEHNDHDVKYYFTLFEESTICYDPFVVRIYKYGGQLLSFPATKQMGIKEDFIVLTAGNYYFTTPNLDVESFKGKQIVPIGIKETTNDAPMSNVEMLTLTTGLSYEVSVEEGKTIKYFKIYVPSSMMVKITYGDGAGYLYHIKMSDPIELIDESIFLDQGLYTLMVVYDTEEEKTVTVSVNRDW